jgi:hypothetical protein
LSFNVNYSVGGLIDRVRKIDGIGAPVQVVLPPHLFATYQKPFIKGFRVEMPAAPGEYPIEYTLPQDAELLSIEVGCTGYMDVDYWSFDINGEVVCETIYCKEVAQVKSFGAVKLKAGDVLRFVFNNASGTSKVVWIDMNFAIAGGTT